MSYIHPIRYAMYVTMTPAITELQRGCIKTFVIAFVISMIIHAAFRIHKRGRNKGGL